MGGKDQVAALHTTVIKERPVGMEPHTASQGRAEAADGDEDGEYEGVRDSKGQRNGQGK